LLPTDLANVYIVSRHAGAGASTDDYNSGKAAIGTGAYRFQSYTPGSRIDLVRNDAYWGGAEPWRQVSLRTIPTPAARTAAPLAGDADVIDRLPAVDLPKLGADPRIKVVKVQSLRMMFLMLDRSRTGTPVFMTDNDGKPLDRNPLNDLKVRRALSE